MQEKKNTEKRKKMIWHNVFHYKKHDINLIPLKKT
jgi:hypothetical protein